MKLFWIAIPFFMMLSCGTQEEKKSETKVTKQENHDGHNHAAPNQSEKEIISYKTHDPICKMKREESWPYESKFKDEVVKFCSEPCKNAFDKNPESYTKN